MAANSSLPFFVQISFCDLKAWIESNTFHWYHYDEVTYRGDSFKKNEREALNLPADWPIENLTKEESDYNFMLGHKIYVDNVILTNETTWNKLVPVMNMLEMKSLIRCSINYHPKTHIRLNHSYHTDFPFEQKGALFYINDNDGLTVLEDGTEIESVGRVNFAAPDVTNTREPSNVMVIGLFGREREISASSFPGTKTFPGCEISALKKALLEVSKSDPERITSSPVASILIPRSSVLIGRVERLRDTQLTPSVSAP